MFYKNKIVFFSFNPLSISSHCLQRFSFNENSTSYHIEDPLYLMSCFFVLLPKFCMSLAFSSLVIFCLSIGLLEFSLLGACWASWIFVFMYFCKFGEVSAIIYSNSPLLFSGIPTMHVLLDGVVRVPLFCFVLFFTFLQSFLFLFLTLDN